LLKDELGEAESNGVIRILPGGSTINALEVS